MVPLRCITQMACFAHGGDLMTWCNNSLKAGKGKIMDCKKYMFIDTFPHCLDFCRAQPPRHAVRCCVGRCLCGTRPSSGGQGRREGARHMAPPNRTCWSQSGWEGAATSPQ